MKIIKYCQFWTSSTKQYYDFPYIPIYLIITNEIYPYISTNDFIYCFTRNFYKL